ncbi:hypothetical protein KIH23_13590, partial [Flavobacterium sp. CYK-55]|nr:hypothetical protein [Flavobacterium sp. CYK-55]
PVPSIDVTTGQVSIPAGTPAGNYTIVYQICEKLNPSNCDSATVTISVSASAIIANDDAGAPVSGTNGGTSLANVLVNDTLNGNPVTAAQVNILQVNTSNPGITLSGTSVVVAAGTPAGSYTLEYQICEKINPANCDNAIVTVCVNTAPSVGTITQPTCSVATGSVVLSGLPSGNWTINPGNISGNTSSTTISNLAAGTYNFVVTNSTGCASVATVDVVINPQPQTPAVPTIAAQVTQPTCAVATGSFSVSNYDAAMTYTITPNVGVSMSNTGVV